MCNFLKQKHDYILYIVGNCLNQKAVEQLENYNLCGSAYYIIFSPARFEFPSFGKLPSRPSLPSSPSFGVIGGGGNIKDTLYRDEFDNRRPSLAGE